MKIRGNCRELLVGSLQVESHPPNSAWPAPLPGSLPGPDLPTDGPTVYLLEQARAMCEVSTPQAGSCRGWLLRIPRGPWYRDSLRATTLGSQPTQHPPRDRPTHTQWGAAPEGVAPLPRALSRWQESPAGPPAPRAKDCMAHTERQAHLVYSHPLDSQGALQRHQT